MPSDDRVWLNTNVFIDEAWKFRPPLVDSSTSKWFQDSGSAPSQGVLHVDPASPKFDPQVIYKQMKLDRSDLGLMPRDVMYYSTTGHVDRRIKKTLVDKTIDLGWDLPVEAWLKAEMKSLLDEEIAREMQTALYGDGSASKKLSDQVQQLNDQLYDELHIPRHLQYHPTIKENNMSDRTLRTPESSTVKTKDLSVALRVLGHGYSDEILDALALVQDLKEGERLVKASKLKTQDVGCHLQIIDGQAGVLSDLRDYDTFGRNSNGFVKAVIGGKMYDLRPDDFVVLTALAN